MYCYSNFFLLLSAKIIVELDRNKNFESATSGFSVSVGFWISDKVSDSDSESVTSIVVMVFCGCDGTGNWQKVMAVHYQVYNMCYLQALCLETGIFFSLYANIGYRTIFTEATKCV